MTAVAIAALHGSMVQPPQQWLSLVVRRGGRLVPNTLIFYL